MIKCVIFDLGNVIVKNNPSKASRRLAKYCRIAKFTRDTLFVAPWKLQRLFGKGKISRRAFYRKVVKKTAQKRFPQEKFEKAYSDMFTNNVPVQRIARKLKETYKVMLLSNTDVLDFSYLKHFPVMKIFSGYILSYKVGYLKPHRKIYVAAVRKSGFKANECVFIDDRKENADGARKAGMHGIHYTTNARLRQQLKQLRVKF